MREKEAYSRPEMEVLRFGHRTIITGSGCESVDETVNTTKFKVTLRTFGCDADGGSFNGCHFDIRLPIFGA